MARIPAELKPKELLEYAALKDESRTLLVRAQEKFHLSSRGIHRLLKVALTIADIGDSESIEPKHIAEALQYREQLAEALPDFI